MQIDDTLCKEFVKSVNFQDVRLNNLNVNKNKDISNKEQQGVEVRLEFLLDKYDCFMEEKRFLVYPCFKLTLNSNTAEQIADIEISYELEYSWNDCSEITEDYIKVFIGVNAQNHVWPYGRELISSITTRMGYAALIIEPYVRKKNEN